MLNLKVPAFDLLDGQEQPYTGFGEPLKKSTKRTDKLAALIENAYLRIHDGFNVDVSDPSDAAREIDRILEGMWSQGWSPTDANVNLFSTDFGLAVTGAMLKKYGGEVIFRSDTVLDHLSIWWKAERKEAFPFHHMLKCLLKPEANGVSSYFLGIGHLIDSE